MPLYKTDEGVVVERDEDYVRAFGAGAFTLVSDDTALTRKECCGGDDWLVDEDDETAPKTEKEKK